MDAALLSTFVETIYEAAIDTSRWPEVMRIVTDALRGSCSSVLLTDVDDGVVRLSVNDPRLPEAAIVDYLARYAAIDSVRDAGVRAPVGVPRTEADVVGRHNVDVYNDFYLRWDLSHILGVVILRDGPNVATMSAYRSGSKECFSSEDLRTAAFLARHLARAVAIYRKLAHTNGDREMMFDAVDRLATGVVFVDARGRILLMNRAASMMAAQRDGICTERGELAGCASGATDELRALVARALRANADARAEIAIERPSGKRPYVVVATPVRPHLFSGESPRAMLLITDTNRELRDEKQMLRAIYSLTPSEAILAIALCEGQTLKEIALAKNVSANTIHTQLVSVQHKLGVNRQAEIVSTLLRGPLGVLRRDEHSH